MSISNIMEFYQNISIWVFIPFYTYYGPTTDCDGNGTMVMTCSDDDVMMVTTVTAMPCSITTPTMTATLYSAMAMTATPHVVQQPQHHAVQ